MSMLLEMRQLMHPHYVTNILLSTAFLLLKNISPVCDILFPSTGCELDWKEYEILMFLAIVIIFRTRRSGATTMLAYLTSSFMYCKVAGLVLFFNADFRFGIVYGVLCLLHLLMLPEPTYSGPQNVTYFRGPNIRDELARDRRVVWLVTFYAAWSPACVKFAPIFAQMSADYTLENLRFGKMDVATYPELAKDFCVSDSAFSKQLPTVVLFKEGKEVMRRPTVNAKGQLDKFFFNQDSIKAAFDLNNVHEVCKRELKNRKKQTRTGAGGDSTRDDKKIN